MEISPSVVHCHLEECLTVSSFREFTLGLLILVAATSISAAQTSSKQPAQPTPYKAGVGTAVITPAENMWMAGYAARKKPSEGIAQDLYAKALVIEDETGGRLALVTMDLIGVRREVRDHVATACQEKFGIAPERLLLNASHTHCGPEYRVRPGREEEAKRYQDFLEKTLVRLVGEASDALAPARLSYAHAKCGFAMNRRRHYALSADDINANRAPTAEGVVDHAVPVLCVEDAAGQLKAVAFGYACHNTTLSSVTIPPEEPKYLFNGDYSGFAQERLQQIYPEAVAMFVNGCSGDQNPYPRRDQVHGLLPLELARHHGTTLAYSVVAAREAGPRPLSGPIRAAIDDVELTRNNDKPSHTYPVQVIRIGDQLTLVALGSETVVDYALRLKREIQSPGVWVAGYSNDYSGYIPSRRVALEGGYEAANDFTPDVEERIVGKALKLLERISTPAAP